MALAYLLNIVSDWALALVTLVGSGVLALVGAVVANRSRSKQNERRLTGDPDDPNNAGVLSIVADNNRKIDNLEDTVTEHHADFMDRLDELQDSDE